MKHSDNDIRTGHGTIRRYIGGCAQTEGATVIGIERTVEAPRGNLMPQPIPDPETYRAASGRTHFLTCDPALAQALLARFGVKNGTFTSMEAIIGLPCHYVESATGMLVRLDPLLN